MQDTLEKPVTANTNLPIRLHHNAWVVNDQEATRHFYEDILGMPLIAFWIETANFEGQYLILSHAMYGLEDGSALAFFCFADEEYAEKFKSPSTQVFNHVALNVNADTQARLLQRVEDANLPHYTIEHGYCRSLYVTDPTGLRLEFAVDSPRVDEINRVQLETAHQTMKEWTNGRRSTNNNWRGPEDLH